MRPFQWVALAAAGAILVVSAVWSHGVYSECRHEGHSRSYCWALVSS